jgi:two-component system response regulator FixJ
MSTPSDSEDLHFQRGMEPVVYIVDDDPAVGEAIGLLLTSEGFKTRAFESGSDFLSACSTAMRGCVLLDLCMPELSGLEVQKMLGERDLRVPVIFLTGHGTIPSSSNAFRRGAVDFLEKPVDADALLQRVSEALLLDERRRTRERRTLTTTDHYVHLSDRQKQVLQYIVRGYSSKEMAQELGISHRTVEIYRKQMMRKMNAETLVELMRIVAPLMDDKGMLP